MAELSLLEPDVDLLPLLRDATNHELDTLVELIIKKGWQSSELVNTKVYQAHAPNHEKYPDEIAAEIQKFGGNTIANLFRGNGRPYRDVVRWSAKKLRVRYGNIATVTEIELAILTKEEQKLEAAYQRMTDGQRAQFLKELKIGTIDGIPPSLAAQSIQTLIRAQGFRPYIWLVKNASWLWRALTGAGPSVAANRAATKMLSWILAPEVGIALVAIDALRFATSPARRVTIPCVIHIATMRQKRRRRLTELSQICFPEMTVRSEAVFTEPPPVEVVTEPIVTIFAPLDRVLAKGVGILNETTAAKTLVKSMARFLPRAETSRVARLGISMLKQSFPMLGSQHLGSDTQNEIVSQEVEVSSQRPPKKATSK